MTTKPQSTTEPKEPRLLPCPLLGHLPDKGEFTAGPYIAVSGAPDMPKLYAVVCPGCCSTAYDEDKERVIRKWNTRVPVSAGVGPTVDDPCAVAGFHVCGPKDAELRKIVEDYMASPVQASVHSEPWHDECGHAWERVANVECVECPHCLFRFAAVHTSEPEGYSCPNCEGCPDAAASPVAPVEQSDDAGQPVYDGSMTPEQLERAALIAESRGVDLETAQELVYLRDRAAAVPQSFEEAQLQKLYEDPHPGYDCGGTCVIHSGRFATAPAPSAAIQDEAEAERLRVIAYLSYDTIYTEDFCVRCRHEPSNCECVSPVYMAGFEPDEKLKALKVALFQEPPPAQYREGFDDAARVSRTLNNVAASGSSTHARAAAEDQDQ